MDLSKNIFLLAKLSITQFLLSRNFSFCNKDRDIIFDLETLDRKITVQNVITITKNNDFIIYTYFPVIESFISKEKCLIISNFLNEFSSVFNSYIQEIEDEEYNLFSIKTTLSPDRGTIIDDIYWESNLKTQIDNISAITNFIFFCFPKSEFFKVENLQTQEFKKYFNKCIKDFIHSIKVLRGDRGEINSLSKEELEEEISKEFFLFSTGKKNIRDNFRLNVLVNALNNLALKDDTEY